MAHYPQSKVISALFKTGQPMAFGAGEMIMSNYNSLNGIYFIDSGFVKVYSIGNEGDEYIHIVYGQGELFPLVWAYLGVSESSLFYEAMRDVLVWRISRETLSKKINSNPELSDAVSVQLARQLYVFSNRIENLEYKKADERIAYHLLFLASRFGTRDGDSIVIEAPITHDILADSINLVRETVSREIEKLATQGTIKRVNHQIIIMDVPALEAKINNTIAFDF